MRNIFLFVVAIALCACNQKSATDSGIAVDFTLRTPSIETEQVIQLETRDDALLDDFHHIHSTKNHYIVNDKRKIVVYDKSGKIQQVIAPIGRGPREVQYLYEIYPDEKSIKILDIADSRIVEYGYDGTFISATLLDNQPSEFCAFNDGYLFDYQNGSLGNGHVLAICTPKGDTIKTDIGIVGENVMYGTEKFQAREDHILYLPGHSRIVYKIDRDNKIAPYQTFDFGDHWADESTVNKFKNPSDAFALWKHLQERDQIGFLKFKETGDFLSLNFERGDAAYNWFCDKISGQQYMIRTNNKEPFSVAGSNIVGVEGDSFIFEIPALHYGEYPNLPALEIGETDNPVLVIGRIAQ